MSFSPADITARAEHTGLANAGEMGSECVPCARAAGVQFFYDDPFNTPIPGLEVQLADVSGKILIDSVLTEGPASRGLEDATPGVGALRPELGGVMHGEVPLSAGFLTATTNPSQDIPAVVERAWHLEQDIVASLDRFEISMKGKFQIYVDDWNENGADSIIGDFSDGVILGVTAWWEGEKDFWGTALGALRNSVVAVFEYSEQANREGIPTLFPNAGIFNLAAKFGRDSAEYLTGLFEDRDVVAFLGAMSDLLHGVLAGDIDKIRGAINDLIPLKEFAGAIGEFGAMLEQAFADGVAWLADMLEVLRRTPVLGLMINTAMRCLLLMTPNFWAKALGEGVGFVIPEILIWIISTIIAALSAGAGAALLAQRCVNLARMARNGIKGGEHVAKIIEFLEQLKPIFDKIGDLAKALKQSIDEVGERVMDQAHRVVRSSRYWRTRLDDLARQGHGPQKHEGDVTDAQLFERVFRGVDPETNTIRRNAKGEIIGVGKHSTKFHTPADYVRAYDAALEHPDYLSFLNGSDIRVEIPIKMSDVFGPNFQSRIRGYSIMSGKVGMNPTIAPTYFGPETMVFARFRRENGQVLLTTLFPNP